MREIFSILLLAATAVAQPSGVTDARYAHLARGVNLNNWFQYGSPLVVTADDVALLKNAGFTCIRLPVAPQYLLPHWATPSKIDANLAKLDSAIDLFLNAGIAVMLDFQADAGYVAYYWATPAAPQELVSTWRTLAARYANRNPDLLFFEVMNEPTSAWTEAQWDAEQLQVLAAIHEVAPEHTVLAAPASWSGLDALLAMQPYLDPNVIYVMHDYSPVTFTHQGATWTNRDGIPNLRNVPYPMRRQDLQALIDQTSDTTVPPLLDRYQAEDWNSERIEWDIQRAAAWAREWHVRVVVNEFGVYKAFSPPESRARWIADMETALSKYGLGWAMWDYQAGFDLVVGSPGHRSIDPLLVPALGSVTHLDGQAAWPPLTREDLVDLSAQPSRALDDYVRKYKIAFFPGKQDLAFLNDHGVPRDVTHRTQAQLRLAHHVPRLSIHRPRWRRFSVHPTPRQTVRSREIRFETFRSLSVQPAFRPRSLRSRRSQPRRSGSLPARRLRPPHWRRRLRPHHRPLGLRFQRAARLRHRAAADDPFQRSRRIFRKTPRVSSTGRSKKYESSSADWPGSARSEPPP